MAVTAIRLPPSAARSDQISPPCDRTAARRLSAHTPPPHRTHSFAANSQLKETTTLEQMQGEERKQGGQRGADQPVGQPPFTSSGAFG